AGGSSGALTPDADSGAEDGAAGEDGAAPMVCAPGKVEACACPGGGMGAQACREDGSGWGPCECGDAGSGSAGGSGGDGGAGGSGDPRWWCMHGPAANGSPEWCKCEWKEHGNKNVDGCPALPCCYSRTRDGVHTCQCTDLILGLTCDDVVAGMPGTKQQSACPVP